MSFGVNIILASDVSDASEEIISITKPPSDFTEVELELISFYIDNDIDY